MINVRRGDVWNAKLPTIENSKIISGEHPVVIISNWMANSYSNVVSVVPVTSNNRKEMLPTHVSLEKESFFSKRSTALAELTLPLDKSRLLERTGYIPEWKMLEILNAVYVQYGVGAMYKQENIQKVKEYSKILEELSTYLKNNNDDIEAYKRKRYYYKIYAMYCQKNSLPVNYKKYEVRKNDWKIERGIQK